MMSRSATMRPAAARFTVAFNKGTMLRERRAAIGAIWRAPSGIGSWRQGSGLLGRVIRDALHRLFA
jgi:hypothetical protein